MAHSGNLYNGAVELESQYRYILYSRQKHFLFLGKVGKGTSLAGIDEAWPAIYLGVQNK